MADFLRHTAYRTGEPRYPLHILLPVDVSLLTFKSAYPYAPCMVYLPTFIWVIIRANVSKYSIHGAGCGQSTWGPTMCWWFGQVVIWWVRSWRTPSDVTRLGGCSNFFIRSQLTSTDQRFGDGCGQVFNHPRYGQMFSNTYCHLTHLWDGDVPISGISKHHLWLRSADVHHVSKHGKTLCVVGQNAHVHDHGFHLAVHRLATCSFNVTPPPPPSASSSSSSPSPSPSTSPSSSSSWILLWIYSLTGIGMGIYWFPRKLPWI